MTNMQIRHSLNLSLSFPAPLERILITNVNIYIAPYTFQKVKLINLNVFTETFTNHHNDVHTPFKPPGVNQSVMSPPVL